LLTRRRVWISSFLIRHMMALALSGFIIGSPF
jgi:hypothetical protein